MEDLIDGLLMDARLEGLMGTPEFATAKFRLQLMKTGLEAESELSEDQKSYVQRVYTHIKNDHPHFETLTVNDEKMPVLKE